MGRAAEILFVEDNPADQVLAQEVFKDAGWANPPHIFSTGNEALAFLRHEAPFVEAPTPDLIILDYNLPDWTGPELALELKKDRQLVDVPIIIFSTSGESRDIARSYAVGAACYLRKPLDIDAYFRALQGLETLWNSYHAKSARYIRALPLWSKIPRRVRREIGEWALVLSAVATLLAVALSR